MNTENILQSDVLDIIFDKRNKSYGAYTLRKFYNERLYKALGIMAVFAGVVSAFTYLPNKITSSLPIVSDSVYLTKVAEIPKDKPIEPKMPEPPKTPAKPAEILPQANTVDFKTLVITKNEKEVTKITDLTDSVQIGTVLNVKPGAVTPPVVIPATPAPTGGGGGTATNTVNRDIPVLTAEVMPEYPGGMAALRKFLERNLQNPQDLENDETVSVKVKFIVGYDGALKGFETVQDGGKAFNNEVIRVLKKMPQWIPGKSSGQNVSVFYTIPVKFTAAE